MGVTGARATTVDAGARRSSRGSRAVTDLPVGVGLGVSNGEQAAEVAAYADGVIVGLGVRPLPARRPGRGRREGGASWPPTSPPASAAARRHFGTLTRPLTP